MLQSFLPFLLGANILVLRLLVWSSFHRHHIIRLHAPLSTTNLHPPSASEGLCRLVTTDRMCSPTLKLGPRHGKIVERGGVCRAQADIIRIMGD
jgi:hypothetical protein